ncbi:MAG TPA: hypothetical protein VK212_02925 [Lentimicrobium sp.]|nr:hypothetical protein [Lentimicrobium sp.]
MKTITRLFQANYFEILREKEQFVAFRKDRIKVIFDHATIRVMDEKKIFCIPFSLSNVMAIIAWSNLPVIFREELRSAANDDYFSGLFNIRPKTKIELIFADKLIKVMMNYRDFKVSS